MGPLLQVGGVTGFEEARKIGGSGAGEINRDGCFERAARFFG
jgi:hypothetical protein